MINISLKQMVHAIALSEELNFLRAAERVFLTQSALSRSIQGLEQTLGLPLFERSHHAVSLTAHGETFIKRARLMVADAERLQQDMRRWQGGAEASVAFGVGPLIADSLIPELISQARQRYPGLRLQIVRRQADELLALLRAGKIEFLIADRRWLPPDPQLEILALARQEASFMYRAEHTRLSQVARLDAADLLRYGFCSASLPETLQQSLKPLLALERHQELPMVAQTDDLHMLKTLALNSDVLLLSTHASVASELARQGLLTLALPEPLYAEPCIARLAGTPPSEWTQLLLDRLQQRSGLQGARQ
jgi:DNA-binding transcriptional LysR family regulator